MAADVVDKLGRFGIPWIEKQADVGSLLAYYISNESHDSAAILHLVLGDRSAARDQLDAQIRRFPGSRDRLTAWARQIGLDWNPAPDAGAER